MYNTAAAPPKIIFGGRCVFWRFSAKKHTSLQIIFRRQGRRKKSDGTSQFRLFNHLAFQPFNNQSLISTFAVNIKNAKDKSKSW